MIVALHLAYGMNVSQILWFNQLVSHSPSVMSSLVGMLPLEDVPEMVCFVLPECDHRLWNHFWSRLQELHLYATEKVIEKLEPPLQKDNPNANLAQWLNHVRLSQNTIDSILSLRSQSKRVIKARYNIIFIAMVDTCNMCTMWDVKKFLYLLDKTGVDYMLFSCL